MGMFFEEKTKEKDLRKSPRKTEGFFASVFLVVLGFLSDLLLAFFQPFFAWLFDFKHGTQRANKVRTITLLVLFIGGGLLVYKIPFVRDMTLADTSTINISSSTFMAPILSRDYFKETATRKHVVLGDVPQIEYLTYSDAFSDYAVMKSNQCQLVPRGKKITLSSPSKPLLAIGFTDEIEYEYTGNVLSLPFLQYGWEHLLHPEYLFKDKEELKQKKEVFTKSSSWEALEEDWPSLKNGLLGRKEISAQARNNEHAMICF